MKTHVLSIRMNISIFPLRLRSFFFEGQDGAIYTSSSQKKQEDEGQNQ